MISWAQGSGTPLWTHLLLAVAGAALGAALGRQLATGGYRIESDGPGELPGHAWWPAVALALLWGFLAWRIGDLAGWAALPAYLLFAWLTVALVWIDADVHRLPDGLVLPAYPALVVLLAIASLGAADWRPMARALACMAVLFALYFAMAALSPANSLGFGDVKLAGLIGLTLGWLGVSQAVVGVLAGFLVGGVLAVVFLLGRRVGLRSHIAYGPSMLIGSFLSLAVSYQLVA
jgi:leader peptidase (prepilin peptidase) / N-methyltransferase